jgi:hypothetical protein
MKKRPGKSRRAEVLSRLREIGALCATEHEPTEQTFLRTVAQLVDDLGLALQGAQDPAVLLTVMATLAKRRAEGMLLQRVEVWRGTSPA